MAAPTGALRSDDRWLAVVCLLVTAGTHLPLVPEHLREARPLGVAFVLLATACVTLAIALTVRDTVVVWAGVVLLDALAVSAYVVTRTVALAGLSGDVGNWLEPLSFPALTAELLALAVGCSVLARRAVARSSDARPGQGSSVTLDHCRADGATPAPDSSVAAIVLASSTLSRTSSGSSRSAR